MELTAEELEVLLIYSGDCEAQNVLIRNQKGLERKSSEHVAYAVMGCYYSAVTQGGTP